MEMEMRIRMQSRRRIAWITPAGRAEAKRKAQSKAKQLDFQVDGDVVWDIRI